MARLGVLRLVDLTRIMQGGFRHELPPEERTQMEAVAAPRLPGHRGRLRVGLELLGSHEGSGPRRRWLGEKPLVVFTAPDTRDSGG